MYDAANVYHWNGSTVPHLQRLELVVLLSLLSYHQALSSLCGQDLLTHAFIYITYASKCNQLSFYDIHW